MIDTLDTPIASIKPDFVIPERPVKKYIPRDRRRTFGSSPEHSYYPYLQRSPHQTQPIYLIPNAAMHGHVVPTVPHSFSGPNQYGYVYPAIPQQYPVPQHFNAPHYSNRHMQQYSPVQVAPPFSYVYYADGAAIAPPSRQFAPSHHRSSSINSPSRALSPQSGSNSLPMHSEPHNSIRKSQS